MQVIAGKYKGTPLKSPNNQATHPMGAREKNALFNTLAPYAPFAAILDAYAGSGALGIEALSRGMTKYAMFYDNDKKATATIRQNLKNLDLTKSAVVRTTTTDRFVGWRSVCHHYTECLIETEVFPDFDLIIADPPYDKISLSDLALLTQRLNPNGLFAISHPSKITPEELKNALNAALQDDSELTQISHKSYAAANITIFQKS